uniref:Uncharacterized protein n=1 Tax=Romanomermis culicivorax TaxID=13658 RepID=A0A915IAA9_ROMCU
MKDLPWSQSSPQNLYIRFHKLYDMPVSAYSSNDVYDVQVSQTFMLASNKPLPSKLPEAQPTLELEVCTFHCENRQLSKQLFSSNGNKNSTMLRNWTQQKNLILIIWSEGPEAQAPHLLRPSTRRP